MYGYKFLRREHAASFLSGESIRIGTSVSYRYQEDIEAGRGDLGELYREVTPEGTFEFSQLTGNKTDKGRVVISKGCVIVQDINAFMFCMSRRIDRKLIDRMSLQFGCDACIQIRDIHEFARALMRQNETLIRPELRGGPYGECLIGRVRYADIPPDEMKPLDPLLKPRIFLWQNEVRCLWPATKANTPFSASITNAAKHLRLINLDMYGDGCWLEGSKG